MLPAPCYLFSDAHLGFARADVHAGVLALLRHLRTHAGSVVINGDLFEFWFEWRSVVPRSSVRILGALADLRDAGIPVLFVAGNHDCWGGDVLREDIGVDYRLDGYRGDVGGWQGLIEHGDGLRPEADRRYRALRRVLRHPLAIRAFRWLPADFASGLASSSSQASRTHSARDGGRGLRDVAAERLRTDPALELVVFGHSHVAGLERLDGGVYANPGGFVDTPTYLRITPDRIALREWRDSAESADLHALDRVSEKPLAELQEL